MNRYEFVDKMRAFDRFYANLLGKFDNNFYGNLFTLGEANIVAEIYNNQSLSATDISTNLTINKGQLSKMINHLVKNNIVIRIPNKEDKRSYILSLSEKGKQLYLEQTHIVREGLIEETAIFSSNEKDRLESAMISFQRTYEKKNVIKIYEAAFEDFGFVADLHSRVYTDLRYDLSIQKHVLTSLLDYMDNPSHGKIWIAEVNNLRVGSIGIVAAEDNSWEVHWFAVDDKYQGMGIGQKLLAELMQFIHENQIESVYLWTINELVGARNLYAKHGFTMTKSSPNNTWKNNEVIDEKWEWFPIK